jgi:hypothetical protein
MLIEVNVNEKKRELPRYSSSGASSGSVKPMMQPITLFKYINKEKYLDQLLGTPENLHTNLA